MEVRVAFHHFHRKYDLNSNPEKREHYFACYGGKPEAIRAAIIQEDYVPAAHIDTDLEDPLDALERAYFLTQNITSSWYEGDEVEYMGPEEGMRSSMLGDIYWIPSLNEFHLVADFGFEKVEDPALLRLLQMDGSKKRLFEK